MDKIMTNLFKYDLNSKIIYQINNRIFFGLYVTLIEIVFIKVLHLERGGGI